MSAEEGGQYELGRLLRVAQAQVRCASWEEAIRMALDPLVAAGTVEPTYTTAAIERERAYPTGLPTRPYGVALPHADGEVHQPSLSLVALAEPVAFAEMGSPEQMVPCKLVIAMAMLPHQQTDALAALMQLIQQEAFLEAASCVASDDELWRVWQSWVSAGPTKE